MQLIFLAAAGPRPDVPADLSEPDLARLYAHPDPGRPWVRANMITSTDGAAAVGGRSGGLSSAADRSLFALLRTLCDVILVGAGTVRAERYAAVRPEELTPGLRRGQPAVPPIAVISRALSVDLDGPLVTAAPPGARTILITTELAPAGRRSAAAGHADVVIAGQDSVDLALVLAALADRGYRRVLAEGGPYLLGQLAAGQVLDELCLTVSPVIALGDAGRITSGPSAGQPTELSLRHVLHDEGYLFCRYTRAAAAIA